MFSTTATSAEMPKITGTPLIDTPSVLQWPGDRGDTQPNLNDPTSHTLFDFHGEVNG